ncbi:MAG: hypothetical protein HY270_24395 [Deltaproteobacteria bacterium]|nr:hypothetical protein [Deltaproteobacteria bacterium]
MKPIRWIILVGMAVMLAACGSDHEDAPPSAPEATGVLVGGTGPLPGTISGIRYVAGDLQGFTDSQGRFQYRLGQKVVFSIGDLQFQPVDGAALVSPFQLANGSGCATGVALDRVLQVLLSLDADGNSDNGLAFAEVVSHSPPRAVDALSPAEIDAAVQAARPGAATVGADAARDRFIRQVDDEAWARDSVTDFPFFDGVLRSQGIATDGSHWYFSARVYLERTTLDYKVEVGNDVPIPDMVARAGGNHIGDIDVDQGLLYVAIEDGPAFLHPYIVTFDTTTLQPTGKTYLLPQELHTKGVPWVAVDGPRHAVYTAEWSPTQRLNVFDRDHELAFVKTIELTPAIGRVQGAKVFGGALYASSDNDAKTTYKIDLDTGTVIRLFTLDTPTSEAEGLALTADANGVYAHVLNITLPKFQLEHWKRTRTPLRDQLCAAGDQQS